MSDPTTDPPAGDSNFRPQQLALFRSNLELLSILGLVETIDRLERRADMSAELAITQDVLARRRALDGKR